MKKYLFLALSVVVFIAACNKTPTPTQTRLDQFRAVKWQLASGTVAVKLPNGKDTTLNYLNFVPDCARDDYFGFNSSTLGAVYYASNKCSPSEGDSTQFTWSLTNNYNTISLYRGFSFIWSLHETINPFKFDTVNQNPLVLDTIHGINDTLPGFTRVIPVLDTIWTLNFYRDSSTNFNIYNAQITAFSTSSFTINFTMYSTYPDSTHYHTGAAVVDDGMGGTTIIDADPIYRADTFKYKLTYNAR